MKTKSIPLAFLLALAAPAPTHACEELVPKGQPFSPHPTRFFSCEGEQEGADTRPEGYRLSREKAEANAAVALQNRKRCRQVSMDQTERLFRWPGPEELSQSMIFSTVLYFACGGKNEADE